MRKIYLTGLMVSVLACLPVCSQKAQASVKTAAPKNVADGKSSDGPSDSFINALAEAARRNPEAGRLVEEGINAADKGDRARAEECFQRVLATAPTFFGIHLLLGSLYLEQSKTEQGLAELRKEEENHPNSAVYETASQMLIEMGLKQEALISLRKWVQADPTNLEGTLELGDLLSGDKEYAEAVQVLEHAYALDPESSKLQSALAEAYFRNRQPEQGQSLLKKPLAASASPEDLGRVAYLLADNNVDLGLANKYEQRALFQLEAESAATTDEEIGVANTLRLGYLWEVMGWINFRQGDYRVAVSCLEAAWLLSQRPVTGDHLGQAYEKLGRKEEAAHSYVLAIASADGAAEDTQKRYQALTGRKVGDVHAAPPRRSGNAAAGSSVMSPVEELSRLRTVNLIKSPHAPANAIFSIVFSSDKPVEVKYLSGSESLKMMSAQIASAKFKVKFPDSNPVRLFRRGMVVCGTVTGCDVVLLLPDSIHAADQD
jgi:tetratricopeptide (TPR) repeat protein